jgi:hypothetical protein
MACLKSNPKNDSVLVQTAVLEILRLETKKWGWDVNKLCILQNAMVKN